MNVDVRICGGIEGDPDECEESGNGLGDGDEEDCVVPVCSFSNLVHPFSPPKLSALFGVSESVSTTTWLLLFRSFFTLSGTEDEEDACTR